MNEQVVIIVSLYRNELNIFEKTALIQLNKVLGNYPICMVIPESLALNIKSIELEKCNTERFSDVYFENTESYSKLCLSEEFYERFDNYEYMLIHQTDAFIFSDCLMGFVERGYDYIGAPMSDELWKEYHVGNGGLSLRNIKKTLNVVKDKDNIVRDAEKWKNFLKFEDTFFGYCAYRKEVDYTAAPIDVANKFSIDDDRCGGFRAMNKNGLPFGTHRFVYSAYSFWKPVIEAFGYALPAIDEVINMDVLEMDRQGRLLEYIPIWYGETTEDERQNFLSVNGLTMSESYKIWGAGFYGRECTRLLKKIGIQIDGIVDNGAYDGQEVEGISVINPSMGEMRKTRNVIIAVSKYFDEIIHQIENYGNKSIQILSYFSILQNMKKYVEENTPKMEGVTCPYSITIKGGVCGKEIQYPY